MQVVGANGGGVAYSKASVIPWKKRIDEGFYKQKGGGFDMSPGGWFGTMGRQRGGSWFDGLSQGMFGIKQTRRKKLTEKQRQNYLQEYRDYQKVLRPPRKQKGGLSRFLKAKGGVLKQKGVGKKGKKQKGGVLLGPLEKWYGGKSKKQQGEIDAWTAKNL